MTTPATEDDDRITAEVRLNVGTAVSMFDSDVVFTQDGEDIAHDVTVDSFYKNKQLVTNMQFLEFRLRHDTDRC